VKEIKNIYAAYKDYGFVVYSVELGADKEKWQK